MESDPIVFAWRTARGPHAAAALLAAFGALLLGAATLMLFGLLKVAVDGLATAGAMPGMPGPPGAGPVARDLVAAAIAGLALVGLSAVLFVLGILRACAAAESRATDRLRLLAGEAVAGAGPGARDEVRALGALIGATLHEGRDVLASGVALPAFAAAAALLAVLVALGAGPWTALAAAAGLALAFAAYRRALSCLSTAARHDDEEDIATERAVAELAGRLPTLRAHGTAAFERARLETAAAPRRIAAGAARRRAALACAAAVAASVAAPLALPIVAAASTPGGLPALPTGTLAATVTALVPALAGLLALARLLRARAATAPVLGEFARTVAALRARRLEERAVGALPATGEVELARVAAYDPASGERVAGVDVRFALPAHVAVLGERGTGAAVLAQVLAGQIEPTAGRATLGGVPLAAADPVARAKRIAFAGGEPLIMAGSLRQNILYGTKPADAADAEARLIEALTVTGLDRLVYARGLTGPVGAAAGTLTEVLVEARGAVRAALEAEDAARLVDAFDAGRFNRHASVGENILFGVPVGPTFADGDLPAHPFLKAVLEAEELANPLAEMGLSVAQVTLELFADLPDDHPLFERFSLLPAAERGYFADIVGRRADGRRGRRGPAGQQERERLTGLALRYSETRHRFGLVDEAMEARLVSARHSFAALMPADLAGAIEFYDPTRVISAASVQDNLLFGRVADDEAGAAARVRGLVRRVLSERGLDEAVYRVGLAGEVAAQGQGMRGELGTAEVAAIDLARCLVRRPDVLVIENALDALPAREAAAVVERLRAAFTGRGLVVRLAAPLAGPPFDLTLRVDRGLLVEARRREDPIPA